MTHKHLIGSPNAVTTFSTGHSFPTKFLKDALPDAETALFFAKVYELEPQDVALVLQTCVPSDVVNAFTAEAHEHSLDLQDYLVEEFQDENGEWTYPDIEFTEGLRVARKKVEPEFLPEIWKNIELTIAESIKEVAHTISDTIQHMPGRTGSMVFKTMAKVNARRPTLGDYVAGVKHDPIKQVLVVFDVSGSVSAPTVQTIVDDVVGLAYEANASLAIVSNTCTFYEAGAFNTEQVLADAEYMGTHYEMLAPLFTGRDWDVVVCIADYDSSPAAKDVLDRTDGKIGQLFDVSLVNRSTYLAECLVGKASEVRPLLIASNTAALVWQ